MIVSASLTLHGESSSALPTSRIPRDIVSMRAGRVWESLLAAERDYLTELVRTASAKD